MGRRKGALWPGNGTQLNRLSATRTGGHQTEIRSHILTLDVDTYVGARQGSMRTTSVAPGISVS